MVQNAETQDEVKAAPDAFQTRQLVVDPTDTWRVP